MEEIFSACDFAILETLSNWKFQLLLNFKPVNNRCDMKESKFYLLVSVVA